MGIPSGWELVILLAVLVVLFGATKLPTAARSIGQSIRIFKAETRGSHSEDQASSPASEQQSLPPVGPATTATHQPRHHDGTIR
ncbi:MAG TPA: Sec-independent protein translocase subunit TatA [Pseudonocardiaceae bacterium]|nr:Sec-independent protein translocase subunit TatA [Pseudonocardiaceae bacterium]